MRLNTRLISVLVALASLSACFALVTARVAPIPHSTHLPPGQSAYLDRARKQPVDWHPWSREAFEEARKTDRPVLLDVGATWCPWCDLMDRESYADPETASFINRNFIAIRIDYDKDPALSAELERVQAVMNLPAGLPLTAFLTPDHRLFDGGGYFPRKTTSGKPAFRDVLESAMRLYHDRRPENFRDAIPIGE